MRTSIVYIFLAGGMLALGACSTSGEPDNWTLAERAAICRGAASTEIAPTGRQTGDVRRDYECRSVHADSALDRRDRNVRSVGAARSTAIDRVLQGRIN